MTFEVEPADVADAPETLHVSEDSPSMASAKHLRAILADVGAGRLVCSAATRHRIEGAVLALTAPR